MKTIEINGKFYQRKKVRFYARHMLVEVEAPKTEDEPKEFIKPKKRTKKNTKKEE